VFGTEGTVSFLLKYVFPARVRDTVRRLLLTRQESANLFTHFSQEGEFVRFDAKAVEDRLRQCFSNA